MYVPPYPVKGWDGVTLAEKWKDFMQHYSTVTTDNNPNWYTSWCMFNCNTDRDALVS